MTCIQFHDENSKDSNFEYSALTFGEKKLPNAGNLTPPLTPHSTTKVSPDPTIIPMMERIPGSTILKLRPGYALVSLFDYACPSPRQSDFVPLSLSH